MSTAVKMQMAHIGAYTIEEEIGSGATSVVYRARDIEGEVVALKVMRNDISGNSNAAAIRFRKEAETLSKVRHPTLVKLIELGEYEGFPYVALEMIEGDTLTKVLAEKSRFSEDQITSMASSIAGALTEIHRSGYIHRDIKPDNIIVQPNGKIRLIDFGFAGDDFTPQILDQENLGTLFYCSPEQLGLEKGRLDGRSDLFSVGVVLYEAATGEKPFDCTSPGDLIQSIREGKPKTVQSVNAAISPALSEIIMKLLKVDRESRYATAEGLQADLGIKEQLNQNYAQSKVIPLGQKDFRVRRLSELPLLGRKEELEFLDTQARALTENRVGSVLVSGDPGSGKSFLVKKFIENVISKHTATLISCKIQAAGRIPLGPLREAIDNYAREIEMLSPGEKDKAINELRQSAQGVESYVKRLSKTVGEYLQDSEDVAPPSQDIFYSGIAQFFLRLAENRKGLIFQVDDIQWVDQPTESILEKIVSSKSKAPLLVLMTCRPAPHEWQENSRSMSDWEKVVQRKIPLIPLQKEIVGDLTQALLVSDQPVEEKMTEKLFTRTQGNPFAVSQYIYAMLDAGAIYRDGQKWQVNLEKLDSILVSGDVSELIIGRMSRLKETSREVLRVAALVGNVFSERLIREVMGLTLQAIGESMSDALQINLIERAASGDLRFVHDRILEALNSEIRLDSKIKIHQQIAETMEKIGMVSDVFSLARHYFLGDVQKNPKKVYEISLRAAQVSLENFANDQAVEFLARSEDFSKKVQLTKEDYFRLYESFVVAHWRKGSGQQAISYGELALQNTELPIQRGRIHALLTGTYFNENQGALGFREAHRGLTTFGINTYSNFFAIHFFNFVWRVRAFISRLKNKFLPRPLSGDELEKYRLLLNLFAQSCFASYVGLRWHITIQLVPRMLYYLQRMEDRLEAVPALGFYALFLGIKGRQKECLEAIRKATEIAKRYNDNQILGNAQFIASFGVHLSGDPQMAANFSKEMLMTLEKWMAPRWFISSNNDFVGNNLLVRGKNRDALAMARMGFKVGDNAGSTSPKAVSSSVLLGALAALGQFEEAETLSNRIQDLYKDIPLEHLDWAWNLSHRLALKIAKGETVEDIDDFSNRYKRLNVNPITAPLFFRSFYFYHPVARIQRLKVSPREDNLRDAQTALRDLWKCSANLPHWKSHYWMLTAQLNFIRGNKRATQRCLDKALSLAERSKNYNTLFEVSRLRAEIALKNSNESSAIQHLQKALAIAEEHDLIAKSRLLQKEFTDILYRKASVSADRGAVGTDNASARQKEVFEVISSIFSSSTGLQDFVERSLMELIRILGAERAFLFIERRGERDLQMLSAFDRHGRPIPDSRTISLSTVNKVKSDGQAVLLTCSADGILMGAESVVLNDIRSAIAAPIKFNGRVIGVTYLDNTLKNHLFKQDDKSLLDIVNAHLGVFLNSEAVSEQLKGLLEISLASSSLLNVDEIIYKTLTEVLRMTGAEKAFLNIFGENQNENKFYGRDATGENLSSLKGFSTSAVARVRKELKPLIVTSGESGELLGSKSAVLNNLRSIIAAPIMVREKCIGVIYLDSSMVHSIFSAQDLKLLTAVANQMGSIVEASNSAKIELARRELQRDLEVTGAIQQLLLPRSSSLKSRDLEFETRYVSASQSGGDWWDCQFLEPGRFLLTMADVTGHGVGAAMVTAVISGLYRPLLTDLISSRIDVDELLARLQRGFRGICRGDYWATFLTVEIDLRKNHMTWWTGGAPCLAVTDRQGEIKILDTKGSPLGAETTAITRYSEALNAGDSIFICTDGVLELRSEKGREFGTVQLKKFLQASSKAPIEVQASDLMKKLDLWRGQKLPDDDICFTFIRIPDAKSDA